MIALTFGWHLEVELLDVNTIVHGMIRLVISKYSVSILSRRLNCLLLILFASSLIQCEKSKTKIAAIENFSRDSVYYNQANTDSIIVSVHLPPKSATGFNVPTIFSDLYYVRFVNKSLKDSTIKKTIPKFFENQLFNSGLIMRTSTGSITSEQYFLIERETSTLNFEYDKGILTPQNNSIQYFGDEFVSYSDFSLKLANSKSVNKDKYLEELNTIYFNFKNEFNKKNRTLLKEINEYYYIKHLLKLTPNDIEIDNFIKERNRPVFGKLYRNILLNFIKNRIHSLNYLELNSKNYSSDYLNQIAIGVLAFLSQNENKKDPEFKNAFDWLQQMPLYKNNIDEIDNKNKSLNNNDFKTQLKSLVLENTTNENVSFLKLTKTTPSKYYILNFWATWCAPCIEGMNIVKKMTIPDEIAIINLSLDKMSDKEKWIGKSNDLALNTSYIIDHLITENKTFLESIKLTMIPRYLLIDEKMNLIDKEFLSPKEPGYLNELKSLMQK